MHCFRSNAIKRIASRPWLALRKFNLVSSQNQIKQCLTLRRQIKQILQQQVFIHISVGCCIYWLDVKCDFSVCQVSQLTQVKLRLPSCSVCQQSQQIKCTCIQIADCWIQTTAKEQSQVKLGQRLVIKCLSSRQTWDHNWLSTNRNIPFQLWLPVGCRFKLDPELWGSACGVNHLSLSLWESTCLPNHFLQRIFQVYCCIIFNWDKAQRCVSADVGIQGECMQLQTISASKLSTQLLRELNALFNSNDSLQPPFTTIFLITLQTNCILKEHKLLHPY